MHKIVLIEDNADVRETTADILELANYEVITAESGKLGIEKATEHQPDLIICDIMMPGLDGYGVLHILSKKAETASIPFIFLTARAEKEDVRKGMNLGADDYLTKPFEEMELLNAVESRLRKNEILKKEYANNINGLNEFYTEASEYKELKDLSKKRKIKTYKKKKGIFQEGVKADMLYFLSKGKAKTFKTTEDGKEFITGIFQAGDFFGFMPLLSEKDTYTETAIALEDTEVCLIPQEDFFKFLYSNRSVANKFIKMLSNNLMEREEQLLQVSYFSVRQRVAEVLLRVSEQSSRQDGTLPEVTLTREDLASLIGTVKETVIRTLADFKEESLITIDRKGITILDKEGLIKVKS
ncbi:DNA-binding response OmpR family regulator [Catalinimonas alkaloidigena]|uniref:response regulator n=1 Tax=Catalinimonas alkaloidigena TaxID=1075417 RepID=UPI002405B369|nr:response regulator [Catalinimonas alkaloidigena]MDF9801381.1 DNA-binding response OmpR family regulator [Catalinimonas alkaloidigena]